VPLGSHSEDTSSEMLRKSIMFERVLWGRPLLFGTAGSSRTVEDAVYYFTSLHDQDPIRCPAIARWAKAAALAARGNSKSGHFMRFYCRFEGYSNPQPPGRNAL